ncbi:MAG: hypothetical protein SGILL_008444, partial [Bacillariaceae sp.]
LIATLERCDAVLVSLFVNMTGNVVRKLSLSLRYIGVCGSNLRRIDMEAAKECNIVVKHVTGYCDIDTAQWIMASILQNFRLQGPTSSSLMGKTLGVIGLGAVGTQVAKLGEALQMHVLYVSRTTRNGDYHRCDSLDEMLRRCDVIVITTPPHVQVLNSDNLNNIPAHALLVNVSVGLSIEPEAFQKWMQDTTRRNSVIMDAAAGGYYTEIGSSTNVSRLRISEQYAYSTPESKARLSRMIVQHAKDFLDQKKEENANGEDVVRGKLFMAPMNSNNGAPKDKDCLHEDAIILLEDIMVDKDPVIVQLCSSKPDELYQASQVLLRLKHIVGLDLNLGCPQKCAKIGGFGAFLADNQPDLALECIAAMKHKHDGPADFDTAAALIQALRECDTPCEIIVNGSINNVDDAKEILCKTKADGLMIARGFLENPLLLSQSPNTPLYMAARYLDYAETHFPPSHLYIQLHFPIALLAAVMIGTPSLSLKSASNIIPKTGRAAVVGGSLGGLAAANALKRAGWKDVHVYERSPTPLDKKGSGLGYVNVPAWEALRDETPMLRRGRRAHRMQGSFYYGDLWKYLYQGLPEDTVRFGKAIESLKVLDDTSTVSIGEESYDLVVVSDGGFSKLRKHVLGDATKADPWYQREPEYAGYVVWRGGVSLSHIPKHVLRQLQEGVYKTGVYDTILLKQAKDDGEDLWTMGTFIETPEAEVEKFWDKATDGTSRHATNSVKKDKRMPNWLLHHFQQHFSDIPGLVELMECIQEYGEVSPHPQYEIGRIERVTKDRVVILGDAAHMASPRTAVGAHTAILDALALKEAFEMEPNDIDAALELYSKA